MTGLNLAGLPASIRDVARLIEQATERRVLELAFERNAAGQGA